MNNILSGEQLVESQSKTSYVLPSAGVKEFEPSHSWLEGKQIQSALDERKALLAEERVEKWNSLMGAEWQPERCKARVTRLNRHWEVFGHHSDSADWLFPEEALFLLEMNCLECLFNEVPISVQKAYSVLLGETNGCSITEYRVFSHLCRAGYRVVRHLSDLTVTAYERQIRLDQHLSERKTYGEAYENATDNTAAPEEEPPPRPDLPPKKILELEERTEVTIKSQSPEKVGMETEVNTEKQVQSTIEVIDLLDSSEESSEEEEEESSDSDIEIIHESAPRIKSLPEDEEEEEEEDDDEDSDVEIIEVPVPKKNIVVATIESSESEEEEDESDSGSDKSCDGNWKRSQPRKRRKFVRPPTFSQFKYLMVDEFCVEVAKASADPHSQLPSSGAGDTAGGTNLCENSNSVEFLSLEIPSTRNKKFKVDKTRNEILDMIPTMAGYKRKLMTLETADLRLIPESVRPKQDSYTYNTNTLRARVFSTFRGGYRGRRNFRAPIYNNFSPYYNPDRNMQANFQPIAQMFGNDIQSVARGMMQFASSLLMNNQNNSHAMFNSPSNALLPTPAFGCAARPPPEERFRNMFDYETPEHTRFSETPVHTRFSETPVHTRFSETPVHIRFTDPPFTSERESQNWYIQNQGFGSDSSFNSSYECEERQFTPNGSNRGFRGRGGRFRRPSARGAPPFTPSPNFRALPEVDPAYARPDVPLAEDTLSDKVPQFIPIQNSVNHQSVKKENPEIINLTDEAPLPSLKGISNRYVRKRVRLMKRRAAKKQKQMEEMEKNKSADIIFLDNPSVSNESMDTSNVKQEANGESSVNIKIEDATEESVQVKQEGTENIENAVIKTEAEANEVKTEKNKEQVMVKNEESNDVRVKVEQDQTGENVHVEIKIESSSDTSSVSSLPVATALVKSEPIKTETEISNNEVSSSSVKIEQENADAATIKHENGEEDNEEPDSSENNAVSTVMESSTACLVESDSRIEMEVEDANVDATKTSENDTKKDEHDNNKVGEDLNEQTSSCEERPKPSDEMDVEVSTSTDNAEVTQDKCISQEQSKEINESDSLRTESNILDSNLDPDSEVDVTNVLQKPDISVSVQSSVSSNKENNKRTEKPTKVSNWADVKKQNGALTSLKEVENRDNDEGEESDEGENEDDIQPLLRPKNCKTIGTVLSALQIFSPFMPKVSEDLPKLKISFDVYLSSDFRKSQRGLPHFRVAVFGGADPLPSPAQLYELQNRFEDGVPVLRAVVTPGSVVCYSCADVSLPVDLESYSSSRK